MHNIKPKLGTRILDILGAREMTCRELSEKAEINYTTLIRWINGRAEPSLPCLKLLCKALECTPNDLLWGDDDEH